jgi:hypothetical protein
MQENTILKDALLQRLNTLKESGYITPRTLPKRTLLYFRANCQKHDTLFTQERVRVEMKSVARIHNILFEEKVGHSEEIDQFTFVEVAICAAFQTRETFRAIKNLVSFVSDLPEALRLSLPKRIEKTLSSGKFADDVAQIIDELGLTESCTTIDLSCTNRDCIGVDVLKKKPA